MGFDGIGKLCLLPVSWACNDREVSRQIKILRKWWLSLTSYLRGKDERNITSNFSLIAQTFLAEKFKFNLTLMYPDAGQEKHTLSLMYHVLFISCGLYIWFINFHCQVTRGTLTKGMCTFGLEQWKWCWTRRQKVWVGPCCALLLNIVDPFISFINGESSAWPSGLTRWLWEWNQVVWIKALWTQRMQAINTLKDSLLKVKLAVDFLVTLLRAHCQILQSHSLILHFLISHSPTGSLQSAFWPSLCFKIVFLKGTSDVIITKFYVYFLLVLFLVSLKLWCHLSSTPWNPLLLGGHVLLRLPFWASKCVSTDFSFPLLRYRPSPWFGASSLPWWSHSC